LYGAVMRLNLHAATPEPTPLMKVNCQMGARFVRSRSICCILCRIASPEWRHQRLAGPDVPALPLRAQFGGSARALHRVIRRDRIGVAQARVAVIDRDWMPPLKIVPFSATPY